MNRILRAAILGVMLAAAWMFARSPGFAATAVRPQPGVASATPVALAVPVATLFAAPQTAEHHAGGREDLFDLINFIILVAVLVYVLRKPVGQFLTNRSAAVRRGLDEGRAALEAARVELERAEARLGRIETDIAEFKASAAAEWEAEIERLRRAGNDERERIMASARQVIESATQAARLELKRAAAGEAVTRAARIIEEQLDDSGRARLVSRFLAGVENDRGGKRPV